MSLYLTPPTIDPRDYLSALEAAKTAAIRLTSPPGYWDDEIRQTLMREHPYVPSDRVMVNFTQRDDATGTAIGYISISGSPTVSIPIIIKNRELSPLDVMIVRSPTTHSDPGQDQQGAGDMEDDRVVPLDEDTFTQAMDAGQVGDVIPQHQITGAAYTEDASALRLPFRGRTVMASLQVGKRCLPSLAAIMGVTEQQKEAFGKILSSNQQVTAGFIINESVPVADEWLNAAAPANSPFHKIASVEIERGTATVVNDIPVEIKTADFLAADVFLDDEQTKVAIALDAFSLKNPAEGLKRWLIFEDGTYCSAPEKIAGVLLSGKNEDAAVNAMMAKADSASLKLGQTLIFSFGDQIAAPVKLANVRSREDQGVVELTLNDGLDNFKAILDRRIKHATYEGQTDTWVFPADVRILVLDGHATLMPLEPAKVASAIERSLTDSIICDRGQFSLQVRGETFGASQVTEEKIAAQLDTFLTNGDKLLGMVKEAARTANNGVGLIRFGSNIPDVVERIVKQAEAISELPSVLKKDLGDIAMNFEKAVKLAAGIGDPDGVDATLSAGFLTQDNLAEFSNLSHQFHETVSKLARLLLAIRLGYPGDESATVVAMKSLSRVADRLESAGQEV